MSARVETRAPLQTVHESVKMDEANVNPRHVQSTRSCRHGTNEEQPHIGKYRLIKTIGKGNFAKVLVTNQCLLFFGSEVAPLSRPLSCKSSLRHVSNPHIVAEPLDYLHRIEMVS